MIFFAGFDSAKGSEHFGCAYLSYRQFPEIIGDEPDEPFELFDRRLRQALFFALSQPFIGKGRKIVVGSGALGELDGSRVPALRQNLARF